MVVLHYSAPPGFRGGFRRGHQDSPPPGRAAHDRRQRVERDHHRQGTQQPARLRGTAEPHASPGTMRMLTHFSNWREPSRRPKRKGFSLVVVRRSSSPSRSLTFGGETGV